MLFLLNFLWAKWFDVSQSVSQLPVASCQSSIWNTSKRVPNLPSLSIISAHRMYGFYTVTTVENCLHRVKYVDADTEIPHKCWLYTRDFSDLYMFDSLYPRHFCDCSGWERKKRCCTNSPVFVSAAVWCTHILKYSMTQHVNSMALSMPLSARAVTAFYILFDGNIGEFFSIMKLFSFGCGKVSITFGVSVAFSQFRSTLHTSMSIYSKSSMTFFSSRYRNIGEIYRQIFDWLLWLLLCFAREK